MVKKSLLFILIAALFLAGFSTVAYFLSKSQKIEIILKNEPEKPEGIEKTSLDKEGEDLTLDQKIGQLFIVGIKGKKVDSSTEEFVRNYHPGGILLLKENIENEAQLKELIFSLQKIALNDTGLPLFIAVDQEGGIISRINWAEKTAQADIKDASNAYDIAKKRGQDLSKDFITLNFSPVLDNAHAGDFVYERTFKKNLNQSGEMAKSMVLGYKDSKIMSCLKHFPGYVGISFNPEDKLAIVEDIPEVFQFKKAAEALPEFVMVSNVVFKELDQDQPFSFLKTGVDFLKENVAGDYIIISDDLSQNSVLNNFSLEDVVSKPINAGVDMIIFSNWRKDSKQGMDAFKKAVESDKVSQKRIEEAVFKIIKLKQEE